MSDKSLPGLVKRAAVEAIETGKPVNVLFGTVVSASPLKINVDQKMTLGGKNLILSRNVTDYNVNMTVNHVTGETSGGSGDASFAAHSHSYSGTKTYLVRNALKAGEKVILIRVQGGQQFLVLDRVG